MKHVMLCLSLISVSLTGFSQVETGSTPGRPDVLRDSLVVMPPSGLVHDSLSKVSPATSISYYRGVGRANNNSNELSNKDMTIPYCGFTPGVARLSSWSGGDVTVSGGTQEMPGLMKIDSGVLGVSHSVGNWSFYGAGVVNKYGYFRGVHTQWGVTGSASYTFSPSLSFTAFGSYFPGTVPVLGGGLPMSPGMMGYYSTSGFGGYIDKRINENFGVMVGAQMVQNVGMRQFRMEPIVTPYLKFGKVTVGLPVGQIVNGIVRNQIEKRRHR